MTVTGNFRNNREKNIHRYLGVRIRQQNTVSDTRRQWIFEGIVIVSDEFVIYTFFLRKIP